MFSHSAPTSYSNTAIAATGGSRINCTSGAYTGQGATPAATPHKIEPGWVVAQLPNGRYVGHSSSIRTTVADPALARRPTAVAVGSSTQSYNSNFAGTIGSVVEVKNPVDPAVRVGDTVGIDLVATAAPPAGAGARPQGPFTLVKMEPWEEILGLTPAAVPNYQQALNVLQADIQNRINPLIATLNAVVTAAQATVVADNQAARQALAGANTSTDDVASLADFRALAPPAPTDIATPLAAGTTALEAAIGPELTAAMVDIQANQAFLSAIPSTIGPIANAATKSIVGMVRQMKPLMVQLV